MLQHYETDIAIVHDISAEGRRDRMNENEPNQQLPQRARAALETVRDVLSVAGLSPEPTEESQGYTVSLAGDGPRVTGVAYVIPNEARFLFYLMLHERAPKETLPRVAEFITRANFGITIGNYEMDYTTGVIRFKSSIDFDGTDLPPQLVRNAILAAMDGVEAYADALAAVIKNQESPQQAIDGEEAATDE
jgi:hypothetical protein